MRDRLRKLVHSRDYIWTVLSLISFGVYSLIDPTPSLAALPSWIAVACYVMFIVAGLAISGGYWCRSFETLVFGHILGIANCITVAGVVLFSSASPVAILVFGFATALSAMLQKAFLERRELRLAGLL